MVAAAVVVSGAASMAESQSLKTAASQDERSSRLPLLSSEKDNSNGDRRKPKLRAVSSRYLSPSPSNSASNSVSSRRFPSPLISRPSSLMSNAASARSASVDRRRPAAARPLIPELDSKQGTASEVSAATKILVTSTRSLSVSFQGEAFSLPISKAKVAPSSLNLRKGTPERRRLGAPLRGEGDHVENPKPSDHHRWPGKSRIVSRSLDSRGTELDRIKLLGSMIDERRPSLDGRLSLQLDPLKGDRRLCDDDSANELSVLPADITASDSDSVSSGSTSGVQECSPVAQGRNVAHGIAVSARFWQETNSRLRRLQDPGSPLSTSPGSKLIVPPKLRRYSSDGPLSSLRTVRGVVRTASPGKAMTPPVGSSPKRGFSPSRIRNAVSTISKCFSESPSVLSFAVDVWRGKVGESRIIDAHALRLLYNRHLQWRLVNARTEAVLLVQKHNVEKNLWNAWITISDLRDTVTKKRYRLRLLRAKLKLASILKGQMTLLEDWACLEKDQAISLLGAIEALKASTLRLPVIGGATADVPSLKDAIGSAVDVMQAMASSIRSLLPMVEEVNSSVTELTKLTSKERVLLKQSTGFISLLAATHIRDGSLRSHVMQTRQVDEA